MDARAHTESLKTMSHARRLGAQIGFVFKMISERTDLKTSEYAKASFQEFILRLLVAQHREHEEHKRDETHANRAIPYEKVDLDYSVIFNAIMSAFESKKSEPDALANYSLAESTRKIDPAGVSHILFESLTNLYLNREPATRN